MSYPPIYIINLRRNPERKLYMQRQLDAFNLDYQFVDAVDKYDFLSKEYRATLAHQLGIEEHHFEDIYKRLNNNFVCILSHVKVYNLMIENNVALACILEDDGYLLPSFPEILTRSQKIPWDILMLSSQIQAIRQPIRPILEPMGSGKKSKLSEIGYCLLKLIYKIRFNPYMLYLVLTKIVKYMALQRNIISKNKEKDILSEYIKVCTCACACEIGALPIWKLLYSKSISNHYINQPCIYRNQDSYYPTSGMAYMLTLSAAIKWKQVAISTTTTKIDKIPAKLHIKENLNLHIVTPPCVIANLDYLVHSVRNSG